MAQFNRRYELQIEDNTGLMLRYTDLRIKFEVTKSVIGVPNLMKLQLFNLSEETAFQLTQEFRNIRLLAGYEGTESLIFSGQIRNIVHRRDNPTKVAVVFAGDGEQAYKQASVSKTFESGVTIQQLVEDISTSFASFGVSNGKLDGLGSSRNKLRGLSYSGASKDVLNGLGDDYGFNWSIQDGVFTTIGENEADRSVPATLISRSTGMLGSPTVTEVGSDVRTLLNPELLPNRLIQIESDKPEVSLGNLYFRRVNRQLGNGIFKIMKVVHVGDTRGNDWTSAITGRRLSG